MLGEPVNTILGDAFRRWLAASTYDKTAKEVAAQADRVLHECFSELQDFNPHAYMLWWALNHTRYISIKQRAQTMLHELIYKFLADIHNGVIVLSPVHGDLKSLPKREKKAKRGRGLVSA